MTSTTLPFPSSPHCVPTTTMLGTARAPQPREVELGLVEDLGDLQRALAARAEVQHEHFPLGGARAADDEGPADTLRAGVGDRLLEPPADDVARDRGAEVAEPPRETEGRGLLGGEVDDEEVGAGQLDRDALRLHHGEGARDVEGEADRR